MSTNIRFKRSDIPGKVPSLEALELGELAINSADGKLFTKQEIKQPAGFSAIQKIVEIGATSVPNVLYVSKSGDDTNSGKTLGESFASVKKALSVATPGTTIFLKSGEYIEDNPLRVPARVSIVGDNLRNTTVRPKNPTKDIFWVYNGAYIFCMNFKGHIAPSAAVCFPPDGSAGEIVTSPYTQAVTSITTTGTGMRVDGAVTTGLRSMVVDAFTQYNQGGIGIHMLNRGNTQLVSVFTICCDISFLCEYGGFCSINLSNSSFGNYGLVSRGASEVLYRGVVKKSAGRQIIFKNLAKRPNIGDGVLFANYNQATCNRDNGLIVDSLAQDLLYEGTTQSTFAGLRYWAKGEITIGDQGPETVAALDHAKYIAGLITRDTVITKTFGNTETQVRASTLGVSAGTTTPQRLVRDGFAIVSGIVENGPLSPKTVILPDYDLAEPELKRLREQVLSKKQEIQDQTIAFIKATYPTLQYSETKCFRDVGIIIDAVINDMIFGGNYLSIKAARTYISTSGLVIPSNTKTETIEAVKFARDQVIALLTENTDAVTRATANFALITSSIDAGVVSTAPQYPDYQDTDVTVKNLVTNLQANKTLVTQIVIAKVNENYPDLEGNYNQDTCKRDVAYVLDAMCFDLSYGGNSETLDAAKRYYSYANGSRQIANYERVATTDAYGIAQLYSQRVVINDPIEGYSGSQNLNGTATTQTQVNNLGNLFKIFLKQIDSEIVGTSDFIQPNGSRSTDTDLDNGYRLLQANKNFLKAEVIAYLTRSYPAFNYDRVKCARDIGYIVDSVCFDLVHGGNRQAVQSGIYYYGFSNESNVLKTVAPRQINQTINAYLYLKELLADVITCTPRPNPWQGDVEQRTSLPPATVAESYAINNLIDVIVEILREGPNNSEDSIQRTKQAIGLTASTDPNKEKAFNLLVANKQFIQAELQAYININWYEISDGDNTFARVSTATPLSLGTTTTGYPVTTYQPTAVKAVRDAILAAKEDITTETTKFMANNFFDNFSFNKPKCYRDVGLILDAILSDMVFDSNYKTINAAISYFRAYASDVIGPQKVQTVAALQAAKILTLERVVTPAAKKAISTRFDILIDILKDGTVENPAAPSLEYPIPQRNSDDDIDRDTAVKILRDNIAFIKEEVVDYIDSNFTVLSYDREKCARDVGIIIEALGYDLMFGSNFRSITAGRSYMRVNAAKVASGQKLATVGGFKQLKKLVADLLKQNSLAVNSTNRNMDIIIDIVESDGMNVPKFIIPFPETGRNVGYKRARDLVEKNRGFIISEILAYIDQNDVPVGYDQAKCERDLNLILDAVYYDTTYGGTLETQTAAYSYFVGAIKQLDPTGQNADEVAATIAAYTHLKSVISDVAVDTPVTRTTGNSTVQFRSPTGSDGSAAAASDMSDLIQLILSYIDNSSADNGALDIENLTSTPDLAWVDAKLVAEFKKLQTATVSLKKEITDYIDTNYVIFGYDRDVCARDVGLVVDAVRYDMMFDTNFNSIVAGRSYYRAQASVVTKDQKVATMASFEFLKTKLLDLVKTNETATTRVTASMDAILAILENGLTAAPTVKWTPPTTGTTGTAGISTFLAARGTIQTSKETLVKTINSWVIQHQGDYTGFTYGPAQRANCQRDLRFIIDAICYDLTYGGTTQVDIAAKAYKSGVTGDSVLITNDLQVTIDAYEQLASELDTLIVDATVSARVALLSNRIASIIEDTINPDSGPDATVLPSTNWVANALVTLNLSLTNNKTDLGDAITDFVDSRYAYNRDKCARDVGFLIDAMCYDVLYGGNLDTLSAAQSYFDGAITPKSVIPKQVIQTVAAYERLSEVLQDVVRLKAVTPSSKKFLATERATANMDLIKSILDNGEAVAPKRPFALPLPTSGAGNASVGAYLNARNLIAANREFLKAEVIAYIEANTPPVYNQETCKRDVDYILDAVYYDMTYGGNMETIVAGRAYYDGLVFSDDPTGNRDDEIAATTAAYTRLKAAIIAVAQNNTFAPTTGNSVAQIKSTGTNAQPGNSGAANAAGDLIDTIITFVNLDDGDNDDTEVTAGTAWVDSGLVEISDILDAVNNANSSNTLNGVSLGVGIQKQVTDFINANYPDLVGNYVVNTCRRDIGLIIDAVRYDLMFGTNFRSTVAGRSYARTQVTEGGFTTNNQKEATLAAIDFAKAKILEIIAANTVKQSTTSSSKGSSAAGTNANDLIGVILTALGGTNPTPVAASTDWVNVLDSELVTISDAIEAEKTDIKTAVTDYIAANYSAQTQVTATNTTADLITASRHGLVKDQVIVFKGTTTGTGLTADTPYYVLESDLDVNVFKVSTTKGGSAVNLTTNASVSGLTIFDYNVISCERDIGLVVDAVRFDMMFGSNFRTIVAARSYYRAQAALVVGLQKDATIGSFELLRTTLLTYTTTSETARSRVAECMDIVLAVLKGGLDELPEVKLPSPTGYNTDYLPSYGYARNLIDANRAFIKAELTKKITVESPSLDYNNAVCLRDVDYIIDALRYDMTYGGTMETSVAALAYYAGAGLDNDSLPSGQLAITVTAYTYLQTLVAKIALNEDVSKLQVKVPQVFGPQAGVSAAQASRNLAWTVRDYISTIAANPSTVYPDTAWAGTNLSDFAELLGKYKTPNLVASVVDTVRRPKSFPQIVTEYSITNNGNTVTGIAVGGGGVATITVTNDHTFTVGQAIQFTAGADVGSIKFGTTYYVKTIPTSNTFTVSERSDRTTNAELTAATITPGAGTLRVSYFDTDKCARDTALLLDALRFDIAFDTNFKTIIAAQAYSRNVTNAVTGVQRQATIAAFKQLKAELITLNNRAKSTSKTAINTNGTAGSGNDGDTTTLARINTLMDLFITNVGVPLRTVAITGTGGQFSCASEAYVEVGAKVVITGTYGGGGSITGYATGNTYYVISTSGPTNFTLSATKGGSAITTTAGTPTGLTYILVKDVPAKPYSIPTPTGANSLNTPLNAYDRNTLAARTAIENNREFIKAEVIAWIDEQNRRDTSGFTVFAYNRTQCLEDLDSILDAIYYDLTYGGNTETVNAGTAYYEGAVLGADEVTATERAYNYLGTVLFEVARNTPVESFQLAVPQVRGIGASEQVAAKLAGLTDIVINVVKGGVKQLPEPIEPEFLAGDETLAYVRSSLQEQKKSLQARIADYLDSFILQYNTEKCARDVGLIIDCVMYDLVLNSNFQTITAGSVYLQKAAGVVTSYQLGPQLEAINFIKEKCVAVSQTPPLVTNPYIISEIENRFDILYDIVDKGVEVAPAVVNVPPLGAALNPNAINAAKSLIANKEFLKEEVTAYITANYKTYDQSRCSRDVGLIIDAALNDLLLGTNFNSIKAGTAYRRATSSLVISDQLRETLGGIDYALSRVLELTTDATAIASITDSFELIKSIIAESTVPTFVTALAGGSVYALPRATGRDFRTIGYFNAVDFLKDSDNVDDIKDAVSTFIVAQIAGGENPAFTGFVYDTDRQASCEQDIGYILEAMCYDLTYGGNMETMVAGRAYYAGAANESLLVANEVKATLEAYTFMAAKVLDLLVAASIPADIAREAEALILGVRNLIDAAYNSSPVTTTPYIDWVDSAYLSLDGEILTDKATITTDIVDAVSAANPSLAFDSAKCARDIGLVIDAVRYDLMFGTDFRSIVAGRSYKREVAVNVYDGGAQNAAELVALESLKTKLVDLIDQRASVTISQDAQDKVAELMDIIIDIVDGGEVPAASALTTPTGGTDNAYVAAIANAKARIVANKQFLTDEVIAYIIQEKTANRGNFNSTYPGFTFTTGVGETDETKCREDLGFILDAIVYDLTYGGNMETSVAGRAYYNGTVLEENNEKLATLDAYRHLRDVIKLVVKNTSVTRSSGNSTTQNTGGTATSDTVRDNFVAPLVTLVMNYIDTAPQDPVEIAADIKWVPSKLYVFSDALNAAKATVAKTTTDYITANYPALDYDVATCQRDIGLVIDAVRWDMMFNSNFRSNVAGRSYLRRQVTEGDFTSLGQKDASVAGFRIVKLALEDIVKSDATALARVGASMDVVIDILDNGAGRVRTFAGSGALALSIPYGGTVNSFDIGYLAARDRIEANRDFIKAEIAAYIERTGASPAKPTDYDKATCLRDVDYILDAVRYDLTYGGNLATIEAGRAYYNGTSFSADYRAAEIAATVAAYTRLSTILGQIAQNVAVTKTTTGPSANALDQVIAGLAGSAAGATAAQQLITDIKTYIDSSPGASDNAAARLPNTSWVNSNFVSFATTMGDTVASLQQQVTDYVTATFPALDYNVDTCARDVGYVVDAVRYDMMFDNEFRSYVAGRSYSRSQVISGNFTTKEQKAATVAAFKFLKDKLLAIVTGNKEAVRRVTSAMRTLLDTLELGEVTRNSYDAVVASGISLLDENRDTLLSQMGTYLDGISHSFSGYNKDTCLRDIGYVLDAIKYDLTYGGNMETVVAGRAYYEGAVLGSSPHTDHVNATKAAFTELGDKIAAITDFPVSVADTIAALIANVNSLIDDDASVTEVYADASWADVNLKEVSATFRDQIAVIKTAVTSYVTTNFPALTYDAVKCARDVGYVADAISWDMLFDSNFRTTIAGRSYGRLIASAGAFGANQKLATTAAFNLLKNELLALTTNKIAQERITAGMNVILQILDKGLDGSTPSITWGGTPVSVNADQVKQTLLANKDFIVDQVLAKINNEYNPFKEQDNTVGYNEEKCARDVGYIVTAVAYDMVTGSNYQSTIAGLRYLGDTAENVLDGSKEQHMTIQSLKYVKQLLASIVANNSTAVTSVKASMDRVISIINGDLAASDAISTMSFTPSNVTAYNAQGQLTRVIRGTIQGEITDWFSNPTGGYDSNVFWDDLDPAKQALCTRDVGYIVDAITYDLTYGGNWATTIAARAYYVGNSNELTLGVVTAEKTATLAAYEYLKTKIQDRVTGNTIEQELTNVTNDAKVATLIDIIKNVISNGLSALPTVQYPQLLGANNDLEIARNNIVNAVSTISKKTTKYINERAYFLYDVVKCERDLGYILDAVIYDTFTDSNAQSVTAGLAYTRVDAQGAVAAPQKFAILAALTHAKSVLANLVSTSSTVVSRIRSKLGIIIDIINDGGNAPILSFPSTGLTGAVTSNTLQTNKETIKTAIGTYLSTYTANGFSWATLAGRQATCLRDVGYIVDALTHDLTYGGNRATVIAARSYFAGTQAQLGNGTGEKGATLAAYAQLKTTIASYVTGQTTAANALIDIIINYVGGDGTTPALTTIIEPTVTSTNPTITSAKATLLAAKEASVNKVLDYINSREFVRGVYDTTKCARDVGIILDAIEYDLLLGSNFQSVKAGQAYLRSYSKTVTGEQKAATIGALYFLKKALTDLSLTGQDTVRSLMDTIIDIIDRGVIAVPALTFDANGTAAYDNAVATIANANNTAFIKAEVRAWIAINYPELDYDKIACERDVAYILEALRYDLIYGGNSQTVEAGLAYWEGTTLTLGLGEPGQSEATATLGAYAYLRDMIRALILSETTFNAFTPKQISVTKGTFGGASSSTVQDDVTDLIDGIINIIDSANLGAANTTANGLRDLPTINTGDADYTAIEAVRATLVANNTTSGSVNKAVKDAFDGQWFVYNPEKCGRDLGYIVEALAYDMYYGGNTQTRDAGIQYTYKGGLVIPFGTKGPTILSMQYLESIIDDIVKNTTVAPLSGNSQTQDKTHTAATNDNATRTATLVNGIVTTLQKGLAGAPAIDYPDDTNYEAKYVLLRDLIQDNLEAIQADTITYVNEEYSGFGYLQDTCKRDIGLTLDAVAYDLIYGGNSRTKYAAEQYFSGGRLQIPADSKDATAAGFNYLDTLARKIVKNDYVTPLQLYVDQNTDNVAATNSEVTTVGSLFDAFTDIVSNGYISVVTLDATFKSSVDDNTYATFHQVSQITTTGHTLEWVGTGIDVDSALPYNGGVPIEANEIVSIDGGFINFTSTDQKGDFKIGPELTIKRDSGSIVGRAFNKSLLGVITPYILALNE
jgi:hypothetical protein